MALTLNCVLKKTFISLKVEPKSFLSHRIAIPRTLGLLLFASGPHPAPCPKISSKLRNSSEDLRAVATKSLSYTRRNTDFGRCLGDLK